MNKESGVPVSVLIPTRDEERNVGDCIKSVSWAGEVFVYDSLSTDRTIELACALGAKVVQRLFDNFADHKNWALDNVPVSHEWILILDADERVTPELRDEICRVLAESSEINGYYVARKNVFMGRWVRHGGWYPDYQLRLFRRGMARYENRIVHEHMCVQGATGYLRSPLIHHDSKGLERYFDRHNVYSSMEAVEAFRVLSRRRAIPQPETGDAWHWRRRRLKELAYRFLPGRSLTKFLWMYLAKGGFLDGRIGFRYCLLHAFYEYQISLKLEELKDKSSPLYVKYRTYLDDDR